MSVSPDVLRHTVSSIVRLDYCLVKTTSSPGTSKVAMKKTVFLDN